MNNPTVYDYFDLCSSMKNRHMITLYRLGRTYEGIVNSIEAESGSGKTWNVRLHAYPDIVFFIRTT